MLLIRSRNRLNMRTLDTTDFWQLGKPIKYIRSISNYVYMVEAKGPELEYIRKYFKSVPDLIGARNVVWHDQWAKYIAGNLGHER